MKTKLKGIRRLLSRLMFILSSFCLTVGVPCRVVHIACGMFSLGYLVWLELEPYWRLSEEEKRQEEKNRVLCAQSVDGMKKVRVK